jgi:acyl carrier protein
VTNKEKYDGVFVECFMIEKKILTEDFKYQSIPEWDSIGHMGLIAGLEEAFDVMLEMDDIIEFSSYTQGVEILAKYEIKI